MMDKATRCIVALACLVSSSAMAQSNAPAVARSTNLTAIIQGPSNATYSITADIRIAGLTQEVFRGLSPQFVGRGQAEPAPVRCPI